MAIPDRKPTLDRRLVDMSNRLGRLERQLAYGGANRLLAAAGGAGLPVHIAGFQGIAVSEFGAVELNTVTTSVSYFVGPVPLGLASAVVYVAAKENNAAQAVVVQAYYNPADGSGDQLLAGGPLAQNEIQTGSGALVRNGYRYFYVVLPEIPVSADTSLATAYLKQTYTVAITRHGSATSTDRVAIVGAWTNGVRSVY